LVTASIRDHEKNLLDQLVEQQSESMSYVIRMLIREAAEKAGIKPDPTRLAPPHVGKADLEDIKKNVQRGMDFNHARYEAGFNPDWTLRDD
jgi:hypothetical protein